MSIKRADNHVLRGKNVFISHVLRGKNVIACTFYGRNVVFD